MQALHSQITHSPPFLFVSSSHMGLIPCCQVPGRWHVVAVKPPGLLHSVKGAHLFDTLFAVLCAGGMVAVLPALVADGGVLPAQGRQPSPCCWSGSRLIPFLLRNICASFVLLTVPAIIILQGLGLPCCRCHRCFQKGVYHFLRRSCSGPAWWACALCNGFAGLFNALLSS